MPSRSFFVLLSSSTPPWSAPVAVLVIGVQNVAVWGGFAASLILIGHWFPWRALLGRELRRLEAYTYGVVVIALAAIIPLALTGNYYAIAALVVAIASAGAATLAAYAIDGLIAARHDRLDVEDAQEHAAKRHSEYAEFTD